jgi:chromosome segregation ATPase
MVVFVHRDARFVGPPCWSLMFDPGRLRLGGDEKARVPARLIAALTWLLGGIMSISEQVNAVQARAAELKSSADQARRETNEQVQARISQTKADMAARQSAVKEKAGQAAEQTQSQWKSMQADAAAKMQALQDRIGRQRDQRDVKRAERAAEDAEADASDALDYASWVVDQANLAVLDAIDARTWADARAAAAPSS